MRTAAPKDRSYLEQLNFKKLQKGKKPDGNPKLFYQKLQDEAKSGPVFDIKVLETVENLPELPKPVTKWIGNLAVQDKLDDIKPVELGLIIDWVRQSDDGGTTINTLSWDDAVAAQKAWHDSNFQVSDTGEYLENKVVFKSNGYNFVEIDNEKDLDTEGELMGHCVGGDNYWEAVQSGNTKIYSLRDKQNKPHVTMEVTDGEMRQCFGKQNETPVAKYHPALIEFFNKFKYFEGYLLIDNEIPEDKIDDVIRLGNRVTRQNIAEKTKNSAVLETLSKDTDTGVRINVVRNPNTSIDTLKAMTTDPSSLIRSNVARSRRDSLDEVFEILAKDIEPIIRQDVAENLYTPGYILETMTKDNNLGVLMELAGNVNTPIKILKKLALSLYSAVRRRIIYNKSATDEIKTMAEHPQLYRSQTVT